MTVESKGRGTIAKDFQRVLGTRSEKNLDYLRPDTFKIGIYVFFQGQVLLITK